MIGGFVTHVIVYVAVCVFFSLLWVLTGGGSVEQLRHFAAHPASALREDFWPVWAWLSWGLLVLIHLATVVGRALQPSYWRRRRAEWRAALGPLPPVPPEPPVPSVPPASPVPPAPERRRLAVMFTDIVGSTALNETLGDEAWAKVLAQHRDVVRSCMARHGGIEVTTQGDGFLVRFDAPGAAVRCAVALQQGLALHRTSGEFVPELRVGIHAGEAVDHGGDVLGQVVNLAARVVDAAAAGEVLITEQVADALGGHFVIEDRGLVALKGVTQARHLLAVRWSAAPVEVPDEIDLRDDRGTPDR